MATKSLFTRASGVMWYPYFLSMKTYLLATIRMKMKWSSIAEGSKQKSILNHRKRWSTPWTILRIRVVLDPWANVICTSIKLKLLHIFFLFIMFFARSQWRLSYFTTPTSFERLYITLMLLHSFSFVCLCFWSPRGISFPEGSKYCSFISLIYDFFKGLTKVWPSLL